MRVDAVVVVAMEEEARPFLEAATESGPEYEAGRAAGRVLTVGDLRVLVVRSGIGLVNAASAAVDALGRVAPAALVSGGSAGGLAADVEVGDVVVGERVTYAGADATAFGYDRGQVPGMPVDYAADPVLLDAARTLGPVVPPVTQGRPGRLRLGEMVAGDSFVTAANVGSVRADFPRALSTDMETTALAQVAHSYAVPFLSVRGISDLCGPAADQDFHLAVDEAAARSARTVTAILGAARRPD